MLIDDTVHGRGLGMLLLEHLAAGAVEHGVRALVADVLAENRAMIQVLNDLGLDVECHDTHDGTVHVRVPLTSTPRLLAGIEARDHQPSSPRWPAFCGHGPWL